MPRSAAPQVDDYLAVLEMAMLDGFLAEHEKNDLIDTAKTLGLSRGQLLDIHGSYLATMAVVALDDGVVTATERGQLVNAARMLGLGIHDVDTALREARAGRSEGSPTFQSAICGLTLSRVDRVVFTGDMERPRGDWETLATAAGLQPGGVTKSTKVVVAADPNSLSGKAAKARAYGVPIVTEAAFGELLTSLTA